MTTNLEILKHDLRVQRMLVEEHAARAKRLAIEAAFYRRLWKDSRTAEEKHAEQEGGAA